MTHVIHRLQRYVDGELPPDVAREVEMHLQTCAACREEHRALADLWSRVDAAAQPAPTVSVWPGLRGRSATQHTGPAWSWLRGGLAAVALCAGLGLGLSVGGGIGPASTAAYAEDEVPFLQTSATLDQIWWSAGAQDDAEVGS
jgi:anti-sigma factor RsiW